MVHLTLAISDFMLMLLGAALWAGAGIVGAGVAGLAGIGAVVLAVRRWRRPR